MCWDCCATAGCDSCYSWVPPRPAHAAAHPLAPSSYRRPIKKGEVYDLRLYEAYPVAQVRAAGCMRVVGRAASPRLGSQVPVRLQLLFYPTGRAWSARDGLQFE